MKPSLLIIFLSAAKLSHGAFCDKPDIQIENPYLDPALGQNVKLDYLTRTVPLFVSFCHCCQGLKTFWITPSGLILPSVGVIIPGRFTIHTIKTQEGNFSCFNSTLFISNAKANSAAVGGDEGLYQFRADGSSDPYRKCGPDNYKISKIQLKLQGSSPVLSGVSVPTKVFNLGSTGHLSVDFCLPRLSANFHRQVYWHINSQILEVPVTGVSKIGRYQAYRYQNVFHGCQCLDPMTQEPLPFDPTTCWSSVLTIDNVQMEDQGQYKFEALNLKGIGHAEWDIRIQEAPMTTEAPGPECDTSQLVLDLVFILDRSAATTELGFNRQRHVVEQLLQEYKIGSLNVQAAVVTYDTQAIPWITLSAMESYEQIHEAMESIPYKGHNDGTNLASALESVKNVVMRAINGYRYSARHMAFIFSSTGATGPNPVLLGKLLTSWGLEIYGIGWSAQANYAQLQQVTTQCSQVIGVTDWSDHSQHVIHDWMLEKTCESACDQSNQVMDMIFLLDRSITATRAGYEAQQEIVLEMLKSYSIGNNNVQVSLVAVDNKVSPYIPLDALKSYDQIVGAVKTIPYRSGEGRDIASAFLVLKDFIMKPEHGYRKNTRHIAFLFTSGSATGVDPADLAEELRNEDLQIYGIGLNIKANLAQLQKISGGCKVTAMADFNAASKKAVHSWLSRACCNQI